jgi:hypothetical protein
VPPEFFLTDRGEGRIDLHAYDALGDVGEYASKTTHACPYLEDDILMRKRRRLDNFPQGRWILKKVLAKGAARAKAVPAQNAGHTGRGVRRHSQ